MLWTLINISGALAKISKKFKILKKIVRLFYLVYLVKGNNCMGRYWIAIPLHFSNNRGKTSLQFFSKLKNRILYRSRFLCWKYAILIIFYAILNFCNLPSDNCAAKPVIRYRPLRYRLSVHWFEILIREGIKKDGNFHFAWHLQLSLPPSL